MSSAPTTSARASYSSSRGSQPAASSCRDTQTWRENSLIMSLLYNLSHSKHLMTTCWPRPFGTILSSIKEYYSAIHSSTFNQVKTTNPSDELSKEHPPELDWGWKLLTQRVKTCLTEGGKDAIIIISFDSGMCSRMTTCGCVLVNLRISRSPKWDLMICCIQGVFLRTEKYTILNLNPTNVIF